MRSSEAWHTQSISILMTNDCCTYRKCMRNIVHRDSSHSKLIKSSTYPLASHWLQLAEYAMHAITEPPHERFCCEIFTYQCRFCPFYQLIQSMKRGGATLHELPHHGEVHQF